MTTHSTQAPEAGRERAATNWTVAWQGVRDVSPILSGIVPFAMVAGAGGVAAGLSPALTQGMSLMVFAGASQVAAIDLIARGAAWPAVLLAILVVNLRFVMYSAALAPLLTDVPWRARWLAGYVLTDQGFALTLDRHRRMGHRTRLLAYYLGASLTLWSSWQIGTALGIVLGAWVPASWELDFAIPLMFLALLVPALRDRADRVAAATAGAVVLIALALPYNLGLIIAVVVGVAVGLLFADHSAANKAGSP